MFASCVVVHLDKDKVVSPISSRVEDSFVEWILPRLPATEVAAVLDLLENVVPSPIGHTSPHLHPTPECHRSASDAVNEVELIFGEGPVRTHLLDIVGRKGSLIECNVLASSLGSRSSRRIFVF